MDLALKQVALERLALKRLASRLLGPGQFRVGWVLDDVVTRRRFHWRPGVGATPAPRAQRRPLLQQASRTICRSFTTSAALPVDPLLGGFLTEAPPGAEPLLRDDQLFHPFSSSPFPEFRRRAALMRRSAYCPHPDHLPTRTAPLAPRRPDPDGEWGTGDQPPAHVDFECPDCGLPVYCSKSHWMDDYEAHVDICDTLRQINEDDHDIMSRRSFYDEGVLPTIGLEEATINFKSWDLYLYTREHNAVNSMQRMRQITRLLTYPLTIASVLHDNSPYLVDSRSGGRVTGEGLRSFAALRHSLHPIKERRHKLESPPIRIFVLGARAESSLPRPIWQQLSHIFGYVRLQVVFIGPESLVGRESQPLPERTAENPLGMVKEDLGQMSIHTVVDYYNNVHRTGYFAPHDPYFDCFVLFHPGFGHPANSHSWTETVPMLLETKIPVICTGYTELDMERDVKWLQRNAAGEVDMLLQPGENRFRSLRWDLNDLDPNDISCANWGVWAFRGKRYETTRY